MLSEDLMWRGRCDNKTHTSQYRNTGLTRKEDSAAEEIETDKARQMKAKFMLKIIFGYLFPF
jgi:hypothetical protein